LKKLKFKKLKFKKLELKKLELKKLELKKLELKKLELKKLELKKIKKILSYLFLISFLYFMERTYAVKSKNSGMQSEIYLLQYLLQNSSHFILAHLLHIVLSIKDSIYF